VCWGFTRVCVRGWVEEGRVDIHARG
jgi:hypothetical protein